MCWSSARSQRLRGILPEAAWRGTRRRWCSTIPWWPFWGRQKYAVIIFKLLVQLRAIAAVWLATGVRLAARWIPTRRNPADGPSRGTGVAAIVKPEVDIGARRPAPEFSEEWLLWFCCAPSLW